VLRVRELAHEDRRRSRQRLRESGNGGVWDSEGRTEAEGGGGDQGLQHQRGHGGFPAPQRSHRFVVSRAAAAGGNGGGALGAAGARGGGPEARGGEGRAAGKKAAGLSAAAAAASAGVSNVMMGGGKRLARGSGGPGRSPFSDLERRGMGAVVRSPLANVR